jgi:hypothetical protein
MLAPVTHILPLTTIVRTRLLPIPGKVLVRVGQRVSPADVIAETFFGRDHVLVDVAKKLGLSAAKADALLAKLKRGQRVTQNALILEAGGLFTREVRSPVDGRVVAVGGGKILLETGDAGFELRAGLSGVISHVMEGRGAVIRSTGALVQAVWGNGRMDSGLLVNLSQKPDDVLVSSQLDVSQRGSVILSGSMDDPEAMRAAIDLPVRALILASLSTALIPLAMQARFPILLTEGFGRRPMNATAYKLLTTNVKREVSVNAEMFDAGTGSRPEVIVPLPVQQEPAEPRDVETFAPGQNVRVIRAARAGEIGTLASLRPGQTLLPSGLRAPCGEVRLENGEQIVIPLVNLEVLG